VVGAGTFQGAVDLIETMTFQAAILDIGLPDGNGLELISKIRDKYGDACGIVMLTAFDNPDYRVSALDDGGDAYLVKQASLREIESTLTSVLRRVPHADEPVVLEQGWMLDREGWSLYDAKGVAIPLTFKELTFLLELAGCAPDICPRTQLVEVLGAGRPFDDRNLDTIVRRLRSKILDATGGEAPIRVAYGVGYGFASGITLK